MVSQGSAHAHACVSDVIEPVALRCNMAYREFFDSTKFREEKIITQLWTQGSYIHFVDLKSTIVRSMSRCKRNERAKRAHSLYIYIFVCNTSGMQLSNAHVHWWKVWLTKHVARGRLAL